MRQRTLIVDRIENLHDSGAIKLAWMMGKLISLREFEQVMIG